MDQVQKDQYRIDIYNKVIAYREQHPELRLDQAIKDLQTSATTYYEGKKLVTGSEKKKRKTRHILPTMETLPVPEAPSEIRAKASLRILFVQGDTKECIAAIQQLMGE